MTCSPPPGKVRHRTFGKLLLLFPVSPVQHYSCTVRRTRHTFYSCTVQLYLYTAVPRGTLVLEYQSIPRVSMPYVHACTHTQLSDVHCAELMYQPCTHVYSCVHTAAATAVLVYPWSTNPERTFSTCIQAHAYTSTKFFFFFFPHARMSHLLSWTMYTANLLTSILWKLCLTGATRLARQARID